MPPPPVSPTPVPEAAGSGSKGWLVALVVVLVGVLAFVLLNRDDDGREGADDLSPPPSSETTVLPTTTSPPTTTTTSTTTTTTSTTVPPVVDLTPTGLSASSTAPDATDASGDVVTYSVQNTVDGDPTTAWRTPGSGVGETITFEFAEGPVVITEVGLIPGYAKVDPVDGTDRFFENRRIRAVEWAFDGATTQGQAFSEDPTVQFTEIASVPTESITLTIMETTDGTRDYAPISEIVVRGYPVG